MKRTIADDDADEVDAGTDDFDDDWAEDVVVDESDDAIPADLELNPTGEEWFVTGFEDDGDNQEEGAEPREGDLRDSADMPVIRRPSPGAKPAQAARPGKAGRKRRRGRSVFDGRQAGQRPRRALAGADLLSA